MSSTLELEERLRAHFAEQVARDVLEKSRLHRAWRRLERALAVPA